MLLQCHYLQCVIAELLHMRKDIDPEIFERGDFFLLGAHADMAFIDKGMRARTRALVLPDVRLFGLPHLGAEHLGHRVLDHTAHIRRQTFSAAARPFDEQLVKLAVMQEHRRKPDFPVSAACRLQCVCGGALPVVEFAYKVYAAGIRRPFAENPVPVGLTMQSIKKVVVQSLGQRAVHGDLVAFRFNASVSGFYRFLVRSQVRVRLVYH